MGSLKGQIEEEWYMVVVAPQDLLHSGRTEGTFEGFLIYLPLCMHECIFKNVYFSPFNVEQSGIVASHLPCRSVSVMQVKSTSFSPITALIGEVIPTASQHAQETLKAASCG